MEPSASTFISRPLMDALEQDHNAMGSLIEAKPWLSKYCVRYTRRSCPELAMALVRMAAKEFRPEVRAELRAFARAVEYVEDGRL